ncbi:MAG: putative toxin-antitoxin system toxin component, PIN family [Candidatus Omnitrophota bacterium]|nr:putative toxin-antitoxin system toxin component, PIN family [Candidatus Omnitrophota bacterium]
MMKVVVDTNVIVSGLLSPYGAPAKIVRMLIRQDVELYVDSRIFAEYEEVLKRPKFGFDRRQVDFLLDYHKRTAFFITAAYVDTPMRDPYDRPFLEVAVTIGAFCVITGNVKDYPSKNLGTLKICAPKKFLTAIKSFQ